MRKVAILMIGLLILTSCADSKTFTIDGEEVIVEPYGWANADVKKVKGVEYQVNFGNVVWSVIGVETVFVPIWLTGWELFEPVNLENKVIIK